MNAQHKNAENSDSAAVNRLLLPIMISFIPRSGTTLLMSHLARDSRCLFDRNYPFEKHLLSYMAKISDVLTHGDLEQREDASSVTDLFSKRMDTVYLRPPQRNLDITLSRDNVFKALWSTASQTTLQRLPEALYHAEKCPIWVPFFVRRNVPSLTLSLFRDPRDIFLSQVSYNKRFPSAHFGLRNATDMTRAWQISAQFNSLFESSKELEDEDSIVLLKYEEICDDMDTFLDRLENRIGWKASSTLNESSYGIHATSPPGESRERWKQEVISKRSLQYLQILNFEAMQRLGYPTVVSQDEASTIKVDFSASAQNSYSVEDGTLESLSDQGKIIIESNRSTCRLNFATANKRPGKTMEVWLCVKGGTGSQCSLQWRKRGEQFGLERSGTAPFRKCDHYHVVRFRTCENPRWQEDFAELSICGIFGDDQDESSTRTEIKWVKLVPGPATQD